MYPERDPPLPSVQPVYFLLEDALSLSPRFNPRFSYAMFLENLNLYPSLIDNTDVVSPTKYPCSAYMVKLDLASGWQFGRGLTYRQMHPPQPDVLSWSPLPTNNTAAELLHPTVGFGWLTRFGTPARRSDLKNKPYRDTDTRDILRRPND